MKNLFAHTEPGASYPGFVSINRDENGDVVVTVRSAPKEIAGVYVCGFPRNLGQPGRCVPGDVTCNNYCNSHPDRSLPMADRPKKCVHIAQGVQASFTVPAAEWEAAFGPDE